MTARIYRPARNAMQSGKGKSKQWVLVHEPAAPRSIDPLMGYTSSSDMNQQIKLSFANAIRLIDDLFGGFGPARSQFKRGFL